MFVMKGMFLCKWGHQDIQPAIAFMATRVTESNGKGDWKKLVEMMNYLKATTVDILCMRHTMISIQHGSSGMSMLPSPSTRT
jgi:hypothetical protein